MKLHVKRTDFVINRLRLAVISRLNATDNETVRHKMYEVVQSKVYC
jgi:hypothetical protein